MRPLHLNLQLLDHLPGLIVDRWGWLDPLSALPGRLALLGREAARERIELCLCFVHSLLELAPLEALGVEHLPEVAERFVESLLEPGDEGWKRDPGLGLGSRG